MPHPLRLAPVFQDHAVLQREQPVPVWGWGTPSERVTVRCAGRTAVCSVGSDGRWLLRLPPLPAGGPYEVVAESNDERIALADILVGEVWLCSGQSNMQWPLVQSDRGSADAEGHPQIRLLKVENPAHPGATTAVHGTWTACTPETLLNFSAVGGWFGRELQRALGVPIGLISNAWGGTRVQAWISREALVQDPLGRSEVQLYDLHLHDPAVARDWKDQAEWELKYAKRDPADEGSPQGWRTPGFDDSTWARMSLPGHWQDRGHPFSGVFWFRHRVQVPAAWAGRDLELHLGAIDKHDDTYVNGERVGGLSWEKADSWCTKRVYRIPGRVVGADGRITIAVRARSHIYKGGFSGPGEDMHLGPVGGNAPVSLVGDWRYRIEHEFGVPSMPWGPCNPNSPHILFDSRTAPLIPYALRGAIWYQGESNASEAAAYRRLMPLMIRDWRRAWGQGNFPFLQVQLANYMATTPQPGRSAWAELRDAQLAALAEPATGMAVAIDIGEAGDIHPRNKRDVGRRLARWALAETYGQAMAPSGPLFTGCTSEAEGRIRCRFRHGGGLRTSDGAAVRQVAICGVDRRFVWAQTAIESETLVAWHADVPHPAAIRYAWADNPEGCNLVNADGLPASPFRSDDWPA